jgi:hypothetical protein
MDTGTARPRPIAEYLLTDGTTVTLSAEWRGGDGILFWRYRSSDPDRFPQPPSGGDQGLARQDFEHTIGARRIAKRWISVPGRML